MARAGISSMTLGISAPAMCGHQAGGLAGCRHRSPPVPLDVDLDGGAHAAQDVDEADARRVEADIFDDQVERG